ncbi:hypothetical protein ABE61_22660 [Lysinibacillus sphaericus]|uniref:hypothetical protein n=1 Tax=Lysinibacillus sphaericus TaxID=1421 RepID=UPI0018CC865E|nr:hypothetical protein [Lysinibacillus sphaericus]MBG9456735.1 hypothetical protein [Lysinibacillus sphaericus]MBG9476899.1 hypothetical protein [Lysinibacillus sphaericus]MBG9591448.1 hypothetical protein [Lysinibacillus sphaericus]
MNGKQVVVKAGGAVNYIDKRKFKVNADYIRYANGIKPLLLQVVVSDPQWSRAAAKMLEALVLATKQAEGQDVIEEFKRVCKEFDSVVSDMIGGKSYGI